MASSGQGDDDPQRESRAYNQSIYLFVTAPYVLLAAFGLLVYRGMRKGAAAGAPGGAAGGLSHDETAEPPAVREPGPDGGGPDGAG